jgi:uncharacterized protein (TIGR02594 family)
MEITAYTLAERFVGLAEAPGSASNPAVLAMLKLDAAWPEGDDTPWCSAFCNYVTWLLRLPRSKHLGARSWLQVGRPVARLGEARARFDVVILSRGAGEQPGPDVIAAPGHVGFFAGYDPHRTRIALLGGNQGDRVSVAEYGVERVLGVRRLLEE